MNKTDILFGGFILLIILIFTGLITAMNIDLSKRREAFQAQLQQQTYDLDRLGYIKGDVKIYLKNTKYNMKEFLGSATLQKKYEEWAGIAKEKNEYDY